MIRKKDLSIFNVASKDYTRPILAAVRVTYDETDKKLTLVATDGFQLTQTEITDLEYTPDFTEIIVNRIDFENAAKLAKANDTFEIYSNKFVVKDKAGLVKNELLIANLVEGTYPAYKSLIPQENKGNTIYIDIEFFKTALKAHEGQLAIQVEIDPTTGGVARTRPLSIRNSREDSNTLSAVMPLNIK